MYKGVLFPKPQNAAHTITRKSFPFLYVVTCDGFHLLLRYPNTHSINLPCPRSAEHSSLHIYIFHSSTPQCARHLHQRSLSAACSSVSSGRFFARQRSSPCFLASRLIVELLI